MLLQLARLAGAQPRLQLALDLIMWENYHEFAFPPASDEMKPGEIRRGMWWEPITNCYGLWNNGKGVFTDHAPATPLVPFSVCVRTLRGSAAYLLTPWNGATRPSAAGVENRVTPQSPAASRSMLWLSVLRSDTIHQLTFMLNGNSWSQPQWRGDGGWLQTIAVPQFQAEIKMLEPSLSPLFGSAGLDARLPGVVPEFPAAVGAVPASWVEVETATMLQQPAKPPPATAGFPVVTRGWTEDWCGKRLFAAVFGIKTINLPRQARDKHSQS
jgi:hypothetical protein